MLKILRNLQLNRYFLFSIFIFAYLQSIQTRISFKSVISPYTFTPEAAVASFVSACIIFLIVDLQLRRFQQHLSKPSVALVLKMLINAIVICLGIFILISLTVALTFGTLERNFTLPVFARNNLSAALDVCIYGSFYLVYWYYLKNKKDRQQLADYHQALSNGKIAQLKSQLNPHLLFNNLNILDQLIEEDAEKASRFLNDFSELYRYSLQTSEINLISIGEEIKFVIKYFRVIEHKYEGCYFLNFDEKTNDICGSCIPPLTLQLLIENAVDHNLGTINKPVYIHFNVAEGYLKITNNRVKKENIKTTGGRSLRNLQEQYSLLTNARMQVFASETEFCVKLPIIQQHCK